MMRAQQDPQIAYQHVDFKCRVAASEPRELVAFCYETLISALGTALAADERDDSRLKSASLTRAISALTALQLGISGEGKVVDALNHMFRSARSEILDNVLHFRRATIALIRQDFVEIAGALAADRADSFIAV